MISVNAVKSGEIAGKTQHDIENRSFSLIFIDFDDVEYLNMIGHDFSLIFISRDGPMIT